MEEPSHASARELSLQRFMPVRVKRKGDRLEFNLDSANGPRRECAGLVFRPLDQPGLPGGAREVPLLMGDSFCALSRVRDQQRGIAAAREADAAECVVVAAPDTRTFFLGRSQLLQLVAPPAA
jgi:hypothetical protein